jgi:uncharacterized protein (TIGR02453 family)
MIGSRLGSSKRRLEGKMSYVFPVEGLTFLRDLAANNTKEWFQANKVRYERELKGPARELVAAVNEELARISPDHVTEPGKAVNRINRDIRFAKDKTPYNTKVWAGFHDQTAPKGASAGFYFGFGLEDAGVGAGAWMPQKERLASLRAHFAAHYQRYFAVVEEQGYAQLFEGGQSPRYKRVPAPYAADHPAASLLTLKGVHVSAPLDLGLVTSAELVPTIARYFRKLAPLVALLDEGLGA